MSRAELYRRLLRQAARELRCRITDERCKNLAVLRLCREVISSRLVAGKDIDANALRWLSEQLERYAPAAAPASVSVVLQPTVICAKCQAEIEREPDPSPSPSPRTGPPLPAPIETKPSAAPSLPANVVPLPMKRAASTTARR
jgi:hypothetical protein